MSARYTHAWRMTAALAAFALLQLYASAQPQRRKHAAALQGGAEAPQSSRPAKKNPAPDPPALSVPFRAGERLEFRGGWQFYNGGATLKVAAVEQRSFSGRAAWHFRALATTINPLRYIFVLDDQFDSYSEASGIASLQFEQYIREQNKREDRIHRMSHEGEPAPGNGAVVRVPAGTRDPLGALYYLRSVNWSRTPVVTMPVFDGKKVYDVRARLGDAADEVEVPAGDFTASRIDLRISERGRDVSTVRISLWIASDAARTPVRMEADLPFGAVRAELSRAER